MSCMKIISTIHDFIVNVSMHTYHNKCNMLHDHDIVGQFDIMSQNQTPCIDEMSYHWLRFIDDAVVLYIIDEDNTRPLLCNRM